MMSAARLRVLAMASLGIWMIQRCGVYGTIAGQALNSFIVALILWAAWLRLGRGDPQPR